jgi:hypothetical protein
MTRGFFQRIASLFRRRHAEITIDDLSSGRSGALGVEPLEERIAPGTMIVNPPGGGHGTTVDLPDAADKGLDRAADRSPAVEEPPPEPPVLRI